MGFIAPNNQRRRRPIVTKSDTHRSSARAPSRALAIVDETGGTGINHPDNPCQGAAREPEPTAGSATKYIPQGGAKWRRSDDRLRGSPHNLPSDKPHHQGSYSARNGLCEREKLRTPGVSSPDRRHERRTSGRDSEGSRRAERTNNREDGRANTMIAEATLIGSACFQYQHCRCGPGEAERTIETEVGKHDAAKSQRVRYHNAAGDLRCGRKFEEPVAINSPAAAAETRQECFGSRRDASVQKKKNF